MNQSDIPKLLEAIGKNNLEPVIQLIESGRLDVNAGNECGDSLLHCAILFKRIALVRLLIEKGADLNMTEEIQKKTPLHFGVFADNLHVQGKTPLHLAARCNNLELVRLLLEKGANPDIAEKETGETPLYTAMVLFGRTELVKLLLEKGANPNISVADEAQNGRSSYQVVFGNLGITSLEKRADVNIDDGKLETIPLYEVYYLKKVGVDVNAVNSSETIVLREAVGNNDLVAVKQLIELILLKDSTIKKPAYIIRHPLLSSVWDSYREKAIEIQALSTLIPGSDTSKRGLVSWMDIYRENDENTLRDIFRNEIIKNKIKETDFSQKYPHFGIKVAAYIQANLQIGKIRDNAFEEARKVMSVFISTSGRSLPSEVWEKIFIKINNHDLGKIKEEAQPNRCSIFFNRIVNLLPSFTFFSNPPSNLRPSESQTDLSFDKGSSRF